MSKARSSIFHSKDYIVHCRADRQRDRDGLVCLEFLSGTSLSVFSQSHVCLDPVCLDIVCLSLTGPCLSGDICLGCRASCPYFSGRRTAGCTRLLSGGLSVCPCLRVVCLPGPYICPCLYLSCSCVLGPRYCPCRTGMVVGHLCHTRQTGSLPTGFGCSSFDP